jgi:signal transduction histidine kinase
VAKLDRLGGTNNASLPLVDSDLNFCVCLGESFEMLRPQAMQKNIGFSIDMQAIPEHRRFVRADPLRLRQVFVNVLGNAIKFTDSGSVSVTATLLPSGEYEVRVTDTGAGVPLKYRPHLFTPFTQAERPDVRAKGGTGLGLYLSALVLRSMGGLIAYSDNLPHGSVFTIT